MPEEYHAPTVRLIVKAESPADAELHARTKLQPVCAAWYDAEPQKAPFPPGSLMYYEIRQTQINVSEEPKPECTCREGAEGADPNCYRHSVEKFDGLS